MIAYGFAHGHVRYNTRAMLRHGLIRHAKDSRQLTRELLKTLECTHQAPTPNTPDRACASAAILKLIGHTAAPPATTLTGAHPLARHSPPRRRTRAG